MDECILRERVTLLIHQGKLPHPGVDVACAVRDRPIPRTELELGAEFRRGAGVPGLDVLHVHTRCYALWMLVCDNGDRREQRGETS